MPSIRNDFWNLVYYGPVVNGNYYFLVSVICGSLLSTNTSYCRLHFRFLALEGLSFRYESLVLSGLTLQHVSSLNVLCLLGSDQGLPQAYFTSKQILPFGFAEQSARAYIMYTGSS